MSIVTNQGIGVEDSITAIGSTSAIESLSLKAAKKNHLPVPFHRPLQPI